MRRSSLALAVQRAIQGTEVVPDYIALTGGLDQVTAPLQRKPGSTRSAQNFEAEQLGGYRRIAGYERFDGRPKPSAATYGILAATITGAPAVGQTLTGATSGATGVIIALPGGSFVLTKVVGTFQNGENLNVGGPTIAVATATLIVSGASTPLLHATYNNLAADQYRNDIAAVPGSGIVRGVWMLNDVVYAFRNNAGGTACAMYKSTTGGWSQVSFEFEVAFTNGSGAATIVDGGTLTQGAVTATIRRVLVRTGSLAGGTAAGILVIAAPAGGNFAAGAATVGAGTLTLSGAQTAITLLPGGRFEFVNENFLGGTSTKRMYGVDGINRAFEFDGSYFVPIPTGMSNDTPDRIIAHKKHLFLAFDGSVQHSGPGTPYAFSIVLGASELAMGDTISGFASLPGDDASAALAIFTRNRMSILYGSSASDWKLVTYREELGAYAYSIQDVGFTLFLDDRGLTDLQTSQAFGNFAHAAISDRIRNLINTYRTLVTASCVSRDRNQYRIFFSNKYAFYVTLKGKNVVGIMPQLFLNTVRCACSLEMNDGSEAMFFGSDDGWVFQLDKGTSFDGSNIEAFIELAFHFANSPRTIKRLRDAMVEVQGTGYGEFSFGYTLGYGSTDLAQPANQTVVTSFAATYWDSFTWDSFTWDGQTLLPNIVDLEGEAENYSLAFRSNADYFEPFTLTGVVVQHTRRRRMR